jgi:hypothetical protein
LLRLPPNNSRIAAEVSAKIKSSIASAHITKTQKIAIVNLHLEQTAGSFLRGFPKPSGLIGKAGWASLAQQ